MDDKVYYKQLLNSLQAFEKELRSFEKLNDQDPFVLALLGTIIIFNMLVSDQDGEGMEEVAKFMLNFSKKKVGIVQEIINSMSQIH